MASVEIKDVVLWTKYIDDKALVKRLNALAEKSAVVVEVDGVRGRWVKMKDAEIKGKKNAKPTDGLKPDDAEVKKHWQKLYTTRKGESVSIADGEMLFARLDDVNAENAELKDGVLRARAEAENARKRAQADAEKARKFAVANFADAMLKVRDSLDRAAAVELADQADGASDAVRGMKDGIDLTLKQFDLAMAGFAVVEIEAAPGVKFDPERHQAIGTEASAKVAADHIVSVVQKGFSLHERLLRPAMVVVSKDASESS